MSWLLGMLITASTALGVPEVGTNPLIRELAGMPAASASHTLAPQRSSAAAQVQSNAQPKVQPKLQPNASPKVGAEAGLTMGAGPTAPVPRTMHPPVAPRFPSSPRQPLPPSSKPSPEPQTSDSTGCGCDVPDGYWRDQRGKLHEKHGRGHAYGHDKHGCGENHHDRDGHAAQGDDDRSPTSDATVPHQRTLRPR
jgi:hypothetical protein